MKNWPLRLKISLLAALLGGLAILAFGSWVVWRFSATETRKLDRSMDEMAVCFFKSVAAKGGVANWANEDEVELLFGDARYLFTYEIVEPPGRVLQRSRALGTSSLPSLADGARENGGQGEYRTRSRTYREGGIELRLAFATHAMDQAVKGMLLSYAIALPIVLLGIGLIGSWLTRRALEPVQELAASADRISIERLDERLPEPRTSDEIGHLTMVLNRMMDRLQASLKQARRFSADASHELKTPLTIIRGEVEAALRSGQLPPAAEKTMLNLQEETGRLISIVEGLLLLSQADAGKLVLELQPLDFSTLLADIAEDVEILAGPRNIKVTTKFAEDIVVDAEPHFLRQLVLNLFDNAIKYNRDGGEISAELLAEDGRAVFRLSNTGVVIPKTDHERIFDRFHRADKSRDRTRGGQGLGLSICREIARAHHGEITLVGTETGWTTFQFTLRRLVVTDSGIRRAVAVSRRL